MAAFNEFRLPTYLPSLRHVQQDSQMFAELHVLKISFQAVALAAFFAMLCDCLAHAVDAAKDCLIVDCMPWLRFPQSGLSFVASPELQQQQRDPGHFPRPASGGRSLAD